MNHRGLLILAILLELISCMSCNRQQLQNPVVVHVVRDPSSLLAQKLRQATYEFDLRRPHLSDGRGVMIATNEGDSYPKLLRQLADMPPEVLIVDSQQDLPINSTEKQKLGNSRSVCGSGSAYVLASVSEVEREAANMYVDFLATHC